MDTQQLIIDTAEKIFTDHCDKALWDATEQGAFPTDLWQQIVDNGFHQLGAANSGTAVRCAELVKSVIDNLLPEICGKSPLLSGIPQRFVTVIGEDFLCGIDDELLCIHDVPPAPLP